jgi:hypothetical protein
MNDATALSIPGPKGPLPRTRLSLLYVAGYLTSSGLAMAFAPRLALEMMFATGDYEPTFVRVSGFFILGLAAFVIQAIRHRLAVLYPTIILVRVGFCAGYVALYAQTRDPFFLAVLGIVGFGLALSSACYALDRRAERA